MLCKKLDIKQKEAEAIVYPEEKWRSKSRIYRTSKSITSGQSVVFLR